MHALRRLKTPLLSLSAVSLASYSYSKVWPQDPLVDRTIPPPTPATLPQTTKPNAFASKERVFSRGEVRKHTTEETGIYVTYKDKVYDITPFVKIHPGGSRILLAAGHAIDPYWHIFSIHNSADTFALLSQYEIGRLLPQDEDDTYEDHNPGLDALFANEPKRDPSLIVHSSHPCNAESSLKDLDTHITPTPKFYVRNHLPVPDVPEDTFMLSVEGPGIPDGFKIGLDELKKMDSVVIESTLQCAGNRRKDMNAVKATKGLQWGQGAIGNAEWKGVRLSDVLKKAGYIMPDLEKEIFAEDMQFVHLNGADGYGSSTTIAKALSPRSDVILAYEMNGEQIPADHGKPLRAIIPGVVAARSVKWVTEIVVADDESESHWQRRDYKGFNPSETLDTSDYEMAHSIENLPVQSAFTMPEKNGDLLRAQAGVVGVKGYAVAGGGRAINRVDVSADGGHTWTTATLEPNNQPRGRTWAWTLWHANLDVRGQGEVDLVCKAVDEDYNTQPDGMEGVYNARGVLVSAWQRIRAKVDGNDLGR